MAHQTDFASQYRFMDNAEAERLMEALRDKPVTDADSVPRLFTTNRPNVIFIILESFSSHLLPSLGGENVAPNLDAMSREGVTCTNFWGNSFRTAEHEHYEICREGGASAVDTEGNEARGLRLEILLWG